MTIREPWIVQIPHQDIRARFDYVCGHCSRSVSGRVTSVYQYDNVSTAIAVRFLLCTSCGKGSVWIRPDIVIPGITPGDDLEGLPSEVNEAYEEARKCFSINAYTACELLCRKILMHIAVDKGAEEGKSFKEYIDYLEAEKYITPGIKGWADIIRQNGNKSTHKIEKPDEGRAKATFMFTMELLRIIYEMEHFAKEFAPVEKPKEAPKPADEVKTVE